MAQKRKVLKEVLFDDVEEKIEYDFLTRDQFFSKVPERPMSAHGIETVSYTHLTLPTIYSV